MDTEELHNSTWGLGITGDTNADGGSDNIHQWSNVCQGLLEHQGLGCDCISLEGLLAAPEWPTGYDENSGNGYCGMPDDENIDVDGDFSSRRSSSSVDGSNLSSPSKSSKTKSTFDETSSPKTTTQPAVCKRHRNPPKRPADLQKTETPMKPKRQRRAVIYDDWDNTRGKKGNNNDEDEGEDDEHLKEEARQNSRRSRIREKNRIAAGRCRSKKRKAVSQLTSKHEKLQGMNRQLCGILVDLQAEVYVLKNMLMVHGNSGCELIQQHFKGLAADLILRMHSSTTEHGVENGVKGWQVGSASLLAQPIQSVNNDTDLCLD